MCGLILEGKGLFINLLYIERGGWGQLKPEMENAGQVGYLGYTG